MNRDQKREAKRQAEELMRNPILAHFFDNAEQQLFMRWKATALDQELSDQVRLQLLGLNAFRDFMHTVIVDGQMAERELLEENKKKK